MNPNGVVADVAAAGRVRPVRRGLGLRLRSRAAIGVFMCLPLIVLIGGLVAYPFFYSIYLSLLNKRETAFVGLDKTIERRVGKKTLGFATDAKEPKSAPSKGAAIMSQVQPTDLIKYGLIPEFVGRLPVLATLHDLDKAALIEILTAPKNAIIRQYQRMFDYENVKLRFTDDALEAIADLAISRKIGARGLRMIIEDLMLDLMYNLPSMKKVKECVVTREVVLDREKPITLIEKVG